MANETDVGQAEGGLGKTVAAAIVQYNKVSVMPQTLNMVACPKGSRVAQIPVYTKLVIGDVINDAAGAEMDTTTRKEIATSAITVTALRNHIFTTISDLVQHGSSDAVLINAGQAIGNAVAAEFDSLACTFIDDFATIVGADTTGMSLAKLFSAVANLEKNDAPRPYSCVLHPLSVWGDFGLTNELGNTANNESLGALQGGSAVGDDMRRNGQVSTFGGVSVYSSPQVIGASDYHRGGCYAKTAIGCAYIDFGGGNFIQIETGRDVNLAGTDIAANGYFGFLEAVDLHGVTIKNETT